MIFYKLAVRNIVAARRFRTFGRSTYLVILFQKEYGTVHAPPNARPFSSKARMKTRLRLPKGGIVLIYR